MFVTFVYLLSPCLHTQTVSLLFKIFVNNEVVFSVIFGSTCLILQILKHSNKKTDNRLFTL